MAKYFNEIYILAINDETVPDELILELDASVINYALDESLDTWIKTLNYFDDLNKRLVELAKQKPELQDGCRILNRKLTVIINGMKKVMEKDLCVSGWMRRSGRLEVIL